MSKGFLKLQRAIFTGALWKENRPRTPFEAQLDLLARAMYSPSQALINGTCLNLQPGEMVASVRDLARDWQWSRAKVERFLKNLTKIGDLETRTETGVTVRIINVDGPPGFFLRPPRDSDEAKPEDTDEATPEAPLYREERKSIKNQERKSMTASPSNAAPPDPPRDRPRPQRPARRTEKDGTANGSTQWNRDRHPTLAHLRQGIGQMKRNDQLMIDDRLQFMDLLREICGDPYVSEWANAWHSRWRADEHRCRAALNGLIDDLLNHQHGIRNPVGHLNGIYQRLTNSATQAAESCPT